MQKYIIVDNLEIIKVGEMVLMFSIDFVFECSASVQICDVKFGHAASNNFQTKNFAFPATIIASLRPITKEVIHACVA
jgi:hypothetical protein